MEIEFLDQMEEQAKRYFDEGKLYCSEAVLKTIHDVLDQPMDPSIVKMASGFPVGMGMAQCLCGAVSGGGMALGLVYGREFGEEMNPSMFTYSKALHDYCVEEYGATCCRVITRKWQGDNFASKERHEHCVEITGKITRWVAEQLLKDGKIKKY